MDFFIRPASFYAANRTFDHCKMQTDQRVQLHDYMFHIRTTWSELHLPAFYDNLALWFMKKMLTQTRSPNFFTKIQLYEPYYKCLVRTISPCTLYTFSKLCIARQKVSYWQVSMLMLGRFKKQLLRISVKHIQTRGVSSTNICFTLEILDQNYTSLPSTTVQPYGS